MFSTNSWPGRNVPFTPWGVEGKFRPSRQGALQQSRGCAAISALSLLLVGVFKNFSCWSFRHYLWMWRWILAFQCSVCWDQRAQLACRQHCKLICQIHSVACPLPRHPCWIWNAPLVGWDFDFKFKTTFVWSFASNLSKHLVKLIYSGHGISRDCYCALEWLAA